MTETNSDLERRHGYFLIGAILVTWGAGVTLAAAAGLYNAVNQAAIGPLIVAGIIAPFVAYLLIGRCGARWMPLACGR
jgi:hypothetical protein